MLVFYSCVNNHCAMTFNLWILLYIKCQSSGKCTLIQWCRISHNIFFFCNHISFCSSITSSCSIVRHNLFSRALLFLFLLVLCPNKNGSPFPKNNKLLIAPQKMVWSQSLISHVCSDIMSNNTTSYSGEVLFIIFIYLMKTFKIAQFPLNSRLLDC